MYLVEPAALRPKWPVMPGVWRTRDTRRRRDAYRSASSTGYSGGLYSRLYRQMLTGTAQRPPQDHRRPCGASCQEIAPSWPIRLSGYLSVLMSVTECDCRQRSGICVAVGLYLFCSSESESGVPFGDWWRRRLAEDLAGYIVPRCPLVTPGDSRFVVG